MISLEEDYLTLFTTIQRIVDTDPSSTPQLLAVLLAGGPFRPFLDRPEMLTKVVVMSKQYLAAKNQEAATAKPRGTAPTASGPESTGKKAPARTVSVSQIKPVNPFVKG